jgi:DNA-binding CsgD family transcriptional regulator
MTSSPDTHDENLHGPAEELDASITQALTQLPLPIWITGRDGRMRWLNAGARSMFGSAAGLHFSRFIAPENVNDVRESYARQLLGSPDASAQRATLIGLNGPVSADLVVVPLRLGASVVGVISFAWLGQLEAPPSGRRPPPRLTPRQQDVLELLAHGHSTARIAQELGIADETARNHIRLLLAELGVHTRLEAVVVAFRNGWL